MTDTSPGSISFDRAVDYYDQTRALPPELAERQTDVLIDALAPHAGDGPILEIGVGTGRIALPLTERGVSIVGADISARMLGRFRERAVERGVTDRTRFLLADATALPFTGESAPAVIACHVFHLVGGWETALAEVIRVLRPGGVLLATRGGDGAWRGKVARWFHEAVGSTRKPRGAPGLDDLARAAVDAGLAARRLPEIVTTRRIDLRMYVDELAAGIYSAEWHLTGDQRTAAAVSTRAWLADELGDDTVVDEAHVIAWDAYTKPSSRGFA